MTDIIIPDNVTTISSGAFASCTGLTDMNIGDGMSTISANTFASCTSLTSVIIPGNVTSIGNYAFSNCTSLENVMILDGMISIADKVFYGCTNLRNITIPGSVTSIGTEVFSGCTNLTSAGFIGGGYDYEFGWTEKIPDHAFYKCVDLTDVTIPNSVTSIGYGAFYGCTGLTSTGIPNSVTSIGSNAFYGCTGLTSTGIPNSVTSIGSNAFYGCTGLTSVILPSSVTTVYNGAFSGCNNLTNVTILGDVIFKINSALVGVIDGAFSGCTNLTSAGPIGGGYSYEFGWTEKIPQYAFCGCEGLTNITIPYGITDIGYCAFYKCSSLTDITIPNSVTNIGAKAFSSCISLANFTIPDSITNISSATFYGCTGLTSINIPNNITEIDESAFRGCTGLISVTISDSVTSIGNSAFSNCTSLTNITIPDSVASIREETFYYCTGLTDITIPDRVTVVGDSAFRGCSSLSNVYYGGSEEEWAAISIDSGNTCLTGATIYYNSYVSGTTGPISIVGDGEVSGSGADVEIPCGKTNASAGTFTLQCTISGYSGTVSWTSSDSSVFQLVGDTSVAFTDGSTDITIIGHAAKLGKSVITIKASNGQSFAFTVAVTASVRYLSSWDESTGAVKFDTGLSSALTNYVYNYGDLSGLTGQYVLASTELLSETTGGFETYQIVWIKPVTSALGTITAVSGSTVTIDGTEYPVNDVATCFVYTSTYGGYYAELSSLIGKEVFYHVYDGEIVSVMQLFETEIEGPLALVNGDIAIDGIIYEISPFSDKSFVNNLELMADETVKVTLLQGAILNIELVPGIYFKTSVSEDGVYVIGDTIRVVATMAFSAGTEASWKWTTSDSNAIAFDENGKSTISGVGKSDSGPCIENDSVTLYVRGKSVATTITCTMSDGTCQELILQTFTSHEDAAEAQLGALYTEWEKAYMQYNSALESAISNAANSPDVASLTTLAVDLESKLDEYGIMLSYDIGDESGLYVCKALLKLLEQITIKHINLNGIDITGDWLNDEGKIIKAIANGMQNETYTYKEGTVTVYLSLFIFNQAESGKATVWDSKGDLYSLVGIYGTMEDMTAIANDYIQQMMELDTEIGKQVYKTVFSEMSTYIFGMSPAELTKSLIKDSVKKYAEELEKLGLGDCVENFNACYQFYQFAKGMDSDPVGTLKNFKGITFSSVDDVLTNKAVKAMTTAKDKLIEALESYIENGTISKDSFFSGIIASIKCPVDVNIYDSAGAQIGYVGSSGLYWCNDSISIQESGEAKIIYAPVDVTLRMVGTDYGTLNCTFEEYVDGTAVSRENYYNISLYEGKNVSADISDVASTPSVTVMEEEELRQADETISAESYANESVYVLCAVDGNAGGTVYGAGNYVRGDAVQMLAVPSKNHVFLGWLDNQENLISISNIYEFTATEDVSLTALFAESDTETNTITVDSWTIGGNSLVLSAPENVLDDSTMIYVAKYSDGQMIEIVTGNLQQDGKTVVFNGAVLSVDWKIFILDSAYIPLCGAIEL